MNLRFAKKDGLLLKGFEAIIDIILVILGYYLAFHLRFNFQPLQENIVPLYHIIPYISIAALVVFIFMNMFSMLKRAKVDVLFSLFISLIIINVITAGVLFFDRGFAFPRSVFFVAFLVQFVLIAAFKFIVLLLIKANYQPKDILVLGSKNDTDNIAKKILLNKHNLDRVKYICNTIDKGIYDLIDRVDKIYVGSTVDDEIKSDIVSYCMGINKVVYLVPEIFEISMINAKIVQLDDMPVFEVDNFNLSMERLFIKRAFDIVISTAGLIITLPVMIIIALAVKLHDSGPVLYSQERITRGNRRFKLYKFRTMVVNAEKKTGPVLASDRDPRITSLGNLLRTARLDELPQLINVFKGDMSIVGPRPERQHFINQFSEDIPHFKYRVVVKAGVTGLAQVLGKYRTSPEDKVRFDLLYIRNYSFLLDLKIILKTIQVMFSKESSEGVKEQKPLQEVFSDMNIKTYEETEVMKIEV